LRIKTNFDHRHHHIHMHWSARMLADAFLNEHRNAFCTCIELDLDLWAFVSICEHLWTIIEITQESKKQNLRPEDQLHLNSHCISWCASNEIDLIWRSNFSCKFQFRCRKEEQKRKTKKAKSKKAKKQKKSCYWKLNQLSFCTIVNQLVLDLDRLESRDKVQRNTETQKKKIHGFINPPRKKWSMMILSLHIVELKDYWTYSKRKFRLLIEYFPPI
jgi:hypothetical protein